MICAGRSGGDRFYFLTCRGAHAKPTKRLVIGSKEEKLKIVRILDRGARLFFTTRLERVLIADGTKDWRYRVESIPSPAVDVATTTSGRHEDVESDTRLLHSSAIGNRAEARAVMGVALQIYDFTAELVWDPPAGNSDGNGGIIRGRQKSALPGKWCTVWWYPRAQRHCRRTCSGPEVTKTIGLTSSCEIRRPRRARDPSGIGGRGLEIYSAVRTTTGDGGARLSVAAHRAHRCLDGRARSVNRRRTQSELRICRSSDATALRCVLKLDVFTMADRGMIPALAQESPL